MESGRIIDGPLTTKRESSFFSARRERERERVGTGDQESPESRETRWFGSIRPTGSSGLLRRRSGGRWRRSWRWMLIGRYELQRLQVDDGIRARQKASQARAEGESVQLHSHQAHQGPCSSREKSILVSPSLPPFASPAIPIVCAFCCIEKK